MAGQGEPPYRARQIFHDLYQRQVTAVEEMTALPKVFRQIVADQFTWITVAPLESQQSADGTVKWLSQLADGQFIETVLIPAPRGMAGPAMVRKTVCVSTQVGCAYACAFCASGQAGLRRNLTASEIVQQVLLVQRFLWSEEAVVQGPGPREGVGSSRQLARPSGHGSRATASEAEDRVEPESRESEAERALPGEPTQSRGAAQRVTNVVFMGMGEPLANYDNVLKAIRILNDPEGLHLGARKITISTVGIVPMIERLSKEGLQIEMSVSLHAPNDPLRGKLMPVNAKYPLAQLIPTCHTYTQATKRHITFEYILIDRVNEGEREAMELAALLKGLPCKVNLIPCHPTPGTTWARPLMARMLAFERALLRGGVPCTLRRSRGLDIDGACGQLRLRQMDASPRPSGQWLRQMKAFQQSAR